MKEYQCQKKILRRRSVSVFFGAVNSMKSYLLTLSDDGENVLFLKQTIRKNYGDT